ncbi:zinc finger protein 665-like isoform X2 [Palaemon carinicauda]|uniref:zinc finger protein 665-like isoform X2 n=1 Tax=Palaemon carinicauda TaxID=392227 RepID=UPI0035B68E86
MEERVQNIYQCAVCLKEFSRKSTCKSHMKLHTGERPFECETCGMTFASKSNLTNHVLTHTHQKCATCGKTFTSKPLLKSHMIMHSSERPHECNLCGRCFKRKGELRSHMVTHTGEKRWKCEVCGNLFTERHSLKTHMRLHTGEKPYKCSVCEKTFSRKSSYNSHSRMHTGVKPHKCFVCGKKFAHRSVMVCHSRKHMIRECVMCGMNFMKESELTSHVREQHQDDWPHRCNICGLLFTSNAKVRKHMRLHTEEKPFRCNVCSRQFLHKSALQSHMLSHSESEGRPTCNVCGKSYTAKLSLDIHMRTHTGEKPFACSVCGKKFTRRSGCISHMRLHTGEKPYDCNICGKRFAYSSGIRSHMKLHSRAECNLCGVKLIGGIDPKKHVTHHIVAVGAKCGLCDIEFKSLNVFKSHLYKHTVAEREEECHRNAEVMGIALGQTDEKDDTDENHTMQPPELPVILEEDAVDKKMNIPEVAMLEAFPNQEDLLLPQEMKEHETKGSLNTVMQSVVKVENMEMEDPEFFDTAVLEVTKCSELQERITTVRVTTKQEKENSDDDVDQSCHDFDTHPQDINFESAAAVSPLRDIDSLQSSLSPSSLSNPPSPLPKLAESVPLINSSSIKESITVNGRDFFMGNSHSPSKVITISTSSCSKTPLVSVGSSSEKSLGTKSSYVVTLPKTDTVSASLKTTVKSTPIEVISPKNIYLKELKHNRSMPSVIKVTAKGKKSVPSTKSFPQGDDAKSRLVSASKKLFDSEDMNLANSYSAYVKKMLNLINPPEKQMALIKALNHTMDEFIEKYKSWK